MTKFTGKSQTLTLDGNSLTCITSVSTSESVDVAIAECAGATYKTKVAGLANATMTINMALNQDDVTLLGYIDPGDTGAVVWHPAGATSTFIKFDSTNATVSSRNIDDPVNGICACTVVLELDDVAISAVA